MNIPAPVVVSVDISLLKPWAKNPRKAHAVDEIAKSIEAFGYAAPILVQKGTYRVLAGHGRLEALKKLGVSNVPVLVLDMDDDRADLYTIADNRMCDKSSFTFDKLADILLEFDAKSLNYSLCGFDEDELRKIAEWTPDPESKGESQKCPMCGQTIK